MSKRLLPLIPAGLAVVQVLPAPERVTIVTQPLSATAACPGCGTISRRVHSYYERLLGDLPWQGRPALLRVQARRFRCLDPSCSRQTFAERLPGVAPAAGRRTERLGSLQGCLGLALGGEAGQRLAERLAMPVSADTLLRMTRQAGNDNEPPPTPRVLAVDDWAWRRGRRYGTILVDLERNAVVDLLPDRQAETLAGWLRVHPGIEVVARDRAGAYADGVRQGAPDAVQVADRWHLLRNLGDAVRAVVNRQHAVVRHTAKQVSEQRPMPTVAASVPDSAKPTVAARRSQASRARRQARYEEAARLRAAGVSVSRIAAQLGADRKSIRVWLQAGGASLWRKPPRVGVLAPWLSHLEQRWAEGCRNAALLWRELVRLGYAGRYGTVRSWAGQRRKADPLSAAGQASAGVLGGQPPSSPHLARLLMADTGTLPEAEQAFVSALLQQSPELASGVAVAKRFNLLFRRKSQESLEAVLAAAASTPLAEFAASLRRDLAAVQAALDLPWTTSPAEGQINRLKMLKRTMYGRAGFPLLRARILHAA